MEIIRDADITCEVGEEGEVATNTGVVKLVLSQEVLEDIKKVLSEGKRADMWSSMTIDRLRTMCISGGKLNKMKEYQLKEVVKFLKNVMLRKAGREIKASSKKDDKLKALFTLFRESEYNSLQYKSSHRKSKTITKPFQTKTLSQISQTLIQ